jgi:autotransporter-associated beta strand protein
VTLNGGTLDMQGHSIGGLIPLDPLTLEAGTLMNVGQINAGSAVVKTAAGTLLLAGTNRYTSDTVINDGVLIVEGVVSNGAAFTVNGGALLVNGAVGNGFNSVSVQNGVLGGNGVLRAHSTSINVGGTLAPGASIGSFAISNSVILSGGATAAMEINLTNSPAADKLIAKDIVLGGTLLVTNLGGELALGQSFDLFDGALLGSFASLQLPALPIGLAWDTAQLSVGGDGTIRIVANPPGIVIPPVSQTNQLGSNATFTVVATNATGYQWYFGAVALNGATATNLSLTNLQLNQAGQYRVVVSGAGGSATSAPANLVVVFDAPTPVLIPGGGTVSFSIQAETNRAYWLEAKTDLALPGWMYVYGVTNTNGVVQLQDLLATNLYKYYRVGSTNYP